MNSIDGWILMAYPDHKLPSGALRPPTLVEGAVYLRIDPPDESGPPAFQWVSFIDYHVCPAFVIVAHAGGSRVRCPRQDLWDFPKPLLKNKVFDAPALEREDVHP
jgi:hypothetical protein